MERNVTERRVLDDRGAERPKAVWAVVGVCYLAMMALAIAINLLPVFLTTLSADLGGAAGLSAEQLGRIGAVTFGGLVLGILATGPLADRIGAKPFAVGGNLLIAAGLAVLGFAPGYDTVLIASFVMGLGAGSLDMILSPIVSAVQSERRTLAMNLLHSFYSIGAVATILLSSIALRFDIGWRTVSLALLPMPLVIGAAFVVLRLPAMVAETSVRTPTRTLITRPVFVVLMITIFLGGATEAGMAYWLPAYAEETLGFTRWTAGMSLVGFSLAMAVGRIGILFLPKRVSTITLMLGCCVLTTILFPIASFGPTNTIALVACIAAGLTGSCLWPSTLAVSADKYPNGGATMFGLLAALGNLGGMVMPWIVGAIADADGSSLRYGLLTATLCPLGMIAMLLWLRGRVNRHVDTHVPAIAGA